MTTTPAPTWDVIVIGSGIGGLPTIYESGRISANLLCDDFGGGYSNVDLASDFLKKA